eukprot:snap_masked-scaffold_28-processed-gene-0.10-mRNA-1 protein AED:1.00 eAED:1.00 QI:0/0/0/0/1/1/3/0/95
MHLWVQYYSSMDEHPLLKSLFMKCYPIVFFIPKYIPFLDLSENLFSGFLILYTFPRPKIKRLFNCGLLLNKTKTGGVSTADVEILLLMNDAYLVA